VSAANEKFAAVFLDWWLNEDVPVEAVEAQDAGSMDDLQSLLVRLDAAGLEVVEKAR
jgi:hypothetical protein